MTTNTAPASPPVRQDPRQVENTLRRTLNYNDADVAAAVFQNSLPGGAQVTECIVNVKTAFNAATTNTLVVGTNTPSFNNIVPITAVNLAATGVYRVNTGLGDVSNPSDTTVNAVYSQTGTSATAGQAVITLTYEGGWNS